MRDSDFPWVQLGEACNLITDGSHFSPTPQVEGHPIVNAKDIPNGRIDLTSCTKISNSDWLQLKAQNCAPQVGDILLSKDGTIGRVVHYRKDLGVVLLSSVAILRPDRTFDSEFLTQALRSHIFDTQLFRLQTGSALKRLVLSDIRKIEVLRPPPEIQQHIAEILTTVDEAIEQTEALIVKAQQIKAGLMHDLFTRGVNANGQLRPPHEEAPGLYKGSPFGWIPKEWAIGSVDDFCSQVVDCPHSTPVYASHGIPCIRTADMLPGELLLAQAYRVAEETYYERITRLTPRSGDIIYSREGERLGIASPVGKERICLGQRVMLLRPEHDVDPTFLLWAMNTRRFYRRVVSGLGATTSPHVNVGDIRKQILPRPSKDEQWRIGQNISAIQTKEKADLNEARKLRLTKKGLMRDLLSGKIPIMVGISSKHSAVTGNV